MIISFSNTPLVLACICGLFILTSHCVSAFCTGNTAKWATPLGVLLHVVASLLLFFAGAELDLLVACILFSVLVYSLLNYVAYLNGKKGGSDK